MTRLSSVGFLRATASLPVVAPFAVVGVELLVPSTTAHLPRWLRDSVELAVASVLYFAETELLGLHEGNFARYPIRPAEFTAWQEVWGPRGT